MPGQEYAKVHEIALDQYGYFTAAQATEQGVTPQTLAKMRARGTVERHSRGVYRIPTIPSGRFGAYMEAVLWPQPVRGAISHETALDLLELSDVNPSKIHITVPKAFRTKRQVPSGYVLHFADIDRSEIVPVEGIPTTSPKRAIIDCHKAHVGAFVLLQAIEHGLRNGRLRREEARDLQNVVQTVNATSTPE